MTMKKSSIGRPLRRPNSFFTRLTVGLARIVCYRRVIGAEIIDHSRPAVFTCNHGKISGPVTAVSFLPVRFRPWINACMLDREEATSTMMGTFRDKLKLFGPKLKRRILWMVSGPVCHYLNSFEPIPVYKGMPRESAGTIEQSVDALIQGDSLLIFPEKPRDRYDADSYKDFNTGFAALGRALYERTGQCLEFYPVWSDRKSRSLLIGAPVPFDPSNESRDEKLRISSELQAGMARLKDIAAGVISPESR